MKRPMISIKTMRVFLVLICFLFSACQQSVATDNSALSSGVSSSETSSNEGTVSDNTTPAINYADIVYALPNAEKTSTLDFLPEELQALYQEALDSCSPLYVHPDNLMVQSRYGYQSDGEAQIDGNMYFLYAATYDEYRALLHKIFTERALQATPFYENFTSYNGQLAGRQEHVGDDGLADAGAYIDYYYPDEYIPGEETDAYIAFTLVAYYDRNGATKPEEMDVYTIEYPMLFVKTPDGWRFDEFHTEEYG